MKIYSNYMLIFVLVFIFVACDGSGSSSSKNQSNLLSVDGYVVDGYIKNSQVCIDLNKNNICNTNEPSTTTNDQGYFKFTNISTNLVDTKLLSIISVGGIDTATNETFDETIKNIIDFTGKTKVSGIFLTPLTDIVATSFLNSNSKDSATLKNIRKDTSSSLGINEEELDSNPNEKHKLFAKAQEIQFLKQLIKTSVEKNTAQKLSKNKKNRIKKSISKTILENKDLITSNILSQVENDLSLSLPILEKQFIANQLSEIKNSLNILKQNASSVEIKRLSKIQNLLNKEVKKSYKKIFNELDLDNIVPIPDLSNPKNIEDTQIIYFTENEKRIESKKFEINENTNFSYKVSTNKNTNINYSINGLDKNYFQIDVNGNLTSLNTFDYENALDNNKDNTYFIIVEVSDTKINSYLKIYLDVININDTAPKVEDINLSSEKNSPINAKLKGSDIENNDLSFDLVTSPKNGNITINKDDTFTYTPIKDFVGNDSFTYKANDSIYDSNIASVNISITQTSTTSSFDLLDNDNDGTPDIIDLDDDNDGIEDNNDYRPLDNTISKNPTYTAKLNSYEQTYIREDNTDKNYSNKDFLQLRSLNGKYATAAIVYFDIPSNINSKRVDTIVSSALTLSSIDEKDTVNIYNSTKENFPNASTATWNNVTQVENLKELSNKKLASSVLNPNSSNTIKLSGKISSGKNIFIIDENADNSREKLEKSNSKTYLSISYKEEDSQLLKIEKVANSQANKQGGSLDYNISLKSMPANKVRVYFKLEDNTKASLNYSYLEFDKTNYSVSQKLSITGDILNEGTTENKLLVLPLISEDTNFNGHNPNDIDFKIYNSINSAKSGQAYIYSLPHSLTNAKFELENAPTGMSINEKTARIRWQPNLSQVGEHEFNIIAKDTNTNSILLNKKLFLKVKNFSSNPDGYYVLLKDEKKGNGTIEKPFYSLEDALLAANKNNKPIYIRGGVYEINKTIKINAINGNKKSPIKITRLEGERVKLNINTLYGFKIDNTSSFITIEGLELDGNSNFNHNWVLENLWWDPKGDSQVGGGIGFHIDGNYITIKNNVIHDMFQKGVNIYYGRYVNVIENIVYNIGHSSLSGGHGIMRKWDMDYFKGSSNNLLKLKDTKDTYFSNDGYDWRYDFTGNLVFAVEQRIYSRVWPKGYANLTIDEGKAILTDSSTDYYNNNNPRFRISNNLVVYNGIDHIKLKPYANMQVNNNSIHTDLQRKSPAPDGISDAGALTNLKLFNNIVTSSNGTLGIDVKDTFDAGELSVSSQNYTSGGGRTTNAAGITNLEGNDGSSLFSDILNNDFTSIINNTGVSNDYLDKINSLINDYAIEIKSTNWQHNHLNSTDRIISSIPTKWFDTSTFYIGESSVEVGHKALYIKILDGNNNWLYDVLGKININKEKSKNWASIDSKLTEDYDFDYTDISLCKKCRGAYIYQIIPKSSWFEHYNINDINKPKSITLENTNKKIKLEYLDNTIKEHNIIYQYSNKGKVQLQGDSGS